MAFPELIIFDCDGVLVDSEMISNHILASHLTRHGFPITAEACRARFIGYFMPKLIAEVQAEGVDLPDDFVPSLRARDVEAFARDLKPVPGVREVLPLMPQARCVASSGPPEKIEANLATTGLIDFFDGHLYSGTMVAEPKPAPDLFLYAADQFGIAPSNCLVIEDSVMGIEAAKAAGMTCFAFAGGSHCDDAYRQKLEQQDVSLVFDRMKDLPDLVAKIDLNR